MIRSYCCKNFKCFSDTTDINLTPITILVGPNNSGKSSLIGALNILSLTSQSEDKNIYLKLLSREYDYGTFSDISFQHSLDNNIEFNIVIDKPKKEFANSSRKLSGYIEGDTLKLTVEYGLLKQRKEIFLNTLSVHDNLGLIIELKEDRYSKSISVHYIRGIRKANLKKVTKLIEKDGLFYKIQLNFGRINLINEEEFEYINILAIISQIFESFKQNLQKIYHLGPLRIPPARSYLFSGELSGKIGSTGENALLNYATLSNRRISEEVELIGKINQALYDLGFISKFEVKKVGDRHYEYWAKHPQSMLNANLADSGFGSSQVLPVISLLFMCKPESLLLIEQPELHLHPAAQAELGSIFARACVNRNIKSIIETHSENFILRLLTEVANKHISHNDVTIYYVLPSEGGHNIINIPINEKGEFLKDWPKGFFEEGFDESTKLLKARRGK